MTSSYKLGTFFERCFLSIRGVHGSSWVRLKGIFDPTHHGGLKNIQPNPTHMGRVEPMGWTIFFITIIIKLSRKKNIS